MNRHNHLERGAQLPILQGRGERTGYKHLVPCPRRWSLGALPCSVEIRSHTSSRASSRALSWTLFLLAFCVTFAFCTPGRAQTAPAVPLAPAGPAAGGPTISGPPDVLVIVYQQPGGADQVAVTYAHIVPHAQASADIAALAQLTGWPISARSIKDAASPIRDRSSAMTSVSFQVPGVVQDSTHTFPVEALARAFHNYKRVNAVFFVGPQFQFQGVRSYADNDIKVILDQHGTSYTYQIEILNQSFGRLPLTPGSTGSSPAHRSPAGILLAILGIAALAGLMVYFLAARLPQGQAKRENTDAEADRLEAGARK